MNWEKVPKYCEICFVRIVLKTNSEGLWVCEHCYSGVVDPIKGFSVKAGRNWLCPCGSTLKYKKCCRSKK